MRGKLIIGLLILSVSLSGCQSRVDLLNVEYRSESKQTEDMIYSIASAIKDKNHAELKMLFSVNARTNAISLDEDIWHVMEVFKGDIISLDSISGSTHESNDYGVKEISISKSYAVVTDEDTYLFRIELKRNDNNEEDNGLYQLEIVKEEKDQFLFWMLHFDEPGIFVGNQLQPKDYMAGLVAGMSPIIKSRLFDIFSDEAKADNSNLLEDIEALEDWIRGNVHYDEINDVRVLSSEVIEGNTYNVITSDVTTYTSDDEVFMNYHIILAYIPYTSEDDKGGIYNAYIIDECVDINNLDIARIPGVFFIEHEK